MNSLTFLCAGAFSPEKLCTLVCFGDTPIDAPLGTQPTTIAGDSSFLGNAVFAAHRQYHGPIIQQKIENGNPLVDAGVECGLIVTT